MKKPDFLLRSLAIPALLMAVSAYAAVTGVRITDGKESVVFSFESTPTVTFEDNVIKVTAEEESAEFPMTAGVTFDFVDSSATDNVERDLPEVRIAITATDVMISGIAPEVLVRVYDVAGTLLTMVNADSEGYWSISKDRLPKTPLIFDTGSQVYKLIIR